VDQIVACRNSRFCKRVELTWQNFVLVSDSGAQTGANFDPENFGNR
jgi:hypothetical protein